MRRSRVNGLRDRESQFVIDTSVISGAIERRSVIQLRYHGYHRTVEPHLLGISRKDCLLLRAFQIAGGGVSRETIGWKLFDLSEAIGLGETEQTFSPRPDYRRDDSVMKRVLSRV
jgi:hypothetical protein